MEERIEGSSALEIKKKHTLEEWRSWPADERWELIEGEAWAMSPAPSRLHQKRLGNLATLYLPDMPVPSAVLSGFIWPKRLLYKKN